MTDEADAIREFHARQGLEMKPLRRALGDDPQGVFAQAIDKLHAKALEEGDEETLTWLREHGLLPDVKQ